MAYASKREILAWSMYDFANSAFSTTIVAVVFQAWFIEGVVPKEGARIFGTVVDGPTLWSLAYGTSMALSAFLAPFVGAVCDHTASKKRWQTGFWLAGCGSTAALFFVGSGDWVAGTVLFILANVSFEASVALNSAFLPELAPPERLDRISSVGWGIGYLGGGLCLLLNLVMISHPEWLGVQKETAVRAAFSTVGLWWFLFGLPSILGVKERAVARSGDRPPLRAALAKVFSTLGHMRRLRTLWVLSVSVLLFLAGVNTVLAMSTSFAKTRLRFEDADLILCFLMIQGVAAVGALAMSWISGRVATKTTLVSMLVIWLAALTWAGLMGTQAEFWMLGVVIGLVMGGTQALARGLQARLTPPSSSAEFFGFFSVTQKLAIAGASYIFALTVHGWGIQAGIVSIGIFFVAGLALLLPVDVDRGSRESADEERRLQAERAA